MKKLFTSESVSIGHPDKVADQISDAILDHCLKTDSESRVACETLCTTGRVILSGEITTKADISYATVCGIVRDVVKGIGYDQDGFNWKNLEVTSLLHKQSADIAMGVDSSATHAQGAGDQGMMFGYAEGTAETEYMPLPIYYAHKLMDSFVRFRENTDFGRKYLRPDAKCQLTFDYTGERPLLDTVVISHQHTPDLPFVEFKHNCLNMVLGVVPDHYRGDQYSYLINPTGRFVIGGPDGDTGLTGRKIVVDTYGGVGHVGGGAFSGKDPSKVDRSAAYFCRYVAKHLVMEGLCKKCELQVAYAIGEAYPVSVLVNTFGTGDNEKIQKHVFHKYDFRPAAIIEQLGLKHPEGWSYQQTARNGHFGHKEFPWEK